MQKDRDILKGWCSICGETFDSYATHRCNEAKLKHRNTNTETGIVRVPSFGERLSDGADDLDRNEEH